jgi:hypothetical protein
MALATIVAAAAAALAILGLLLWVSVRSLRALVRALWPH